MGSCVNLKRQHDFSPKGYTLNTLARSHLIHILGETFIRVNLGSQLSNKWFPKMWYDTQIITIIHPMIWETRLSKHSDISRDENIIIEISDNKIYAVSNFVVSTVPIGSLVSLRGNVLVLVYIQYIYNIYMGLALGWQMNVSLVIVIVSTFVA